MQASLNFLSPQKKSLLRTGFIFAYVQNMLFVLFVVVAFCSGLLIALRMMLGETLKNIENQTVGNDRDTKAVTEEITAVNNYLRLEQTYVQGFTRWSAVLTEITDGTPPGIQLTGVNISETGAVEIRGKARERADVLAFEAKLKASPNFTGLTAPLSNILTQYDVAFEFTMNMTNPPKLPTVEVAQPRRRAR